MQACYGHTEGTAGVTGLLLAVHAVALALAPPITNLQNVNPYVAAASGATADHLPRQAQPAPSLLVSHYFCTPQRSVLACFAGLANIIG